MSFPLGTQKRHNATKPNRAAHIHTQKLVNPGFSGGSAAGSLVRASFSPDGRFVVSGSEKGQVRVWEAQEGKRVRTPLQVGGGVWPVAGKGRRLISGLISRSHEKHSQKNSSMTEIHG